MTSYSHYKDITTVFFYNGNPYTRKDDDHYIEKGPSSFKQSIESDMVFLK